MKNRALYSLIPLAVLFGCSHFHRDSTKARSRGPKLGQLLQVLRKGQVPGDRRGDGVLRRGHHDYP